MLCPLVFQTHMGPSSHYWSDCIMMNCLSDLFKCCPPVFTFKVYALIGWCHRSAPVTRVFPKDQLLTAKQT